MWLAADWWRLTIPRSQEKRTAYSDYALESHQYLPSRPGIGVCSRGNEPVARQRAQDEEDTGKHASIERLLLVHDGAL
jgi:hypothetical protein